MAGKINVAAQEGHDVPMQPNLNGGGIKVIPLSIPELGLGELELMCPILDATNAGALKEGGRANANRVSFLGDPRGDGIATVLAVTSASRAAEKIPAILEAVDGGELSPNFSLDLCKGDRAPHFFKEEEKACAELISRWPGRYTPMLRSRSRLVIKVGMGVSNRRTQPGSHGTGRMEGKGGLTGVERVVAKMRFLPA